jgi:hypothetical protein
MEYLPTVNESSGELMKVVRDARGQAIMLRLVKCPADPVGGGGCSSAEGGEAAGLSNASVA